MQISGDLHLQFIDYCKRGKGISEKTIVKPYTHFTALDVHMNFSIQNIIFIPPCINIFPRNYRQYKFRQIDKNLIEVKNALFMKNSKGRSEID